MNEKSCYTCDHSDFGRGTPICANCIPHGIKWQSKEQPKPSTKTALTWQEGGQHYKSNVIQPVVYIHANNLGFCEGNVVKYITRHKTKNKKEDILKAIHYLELLLELEYGDSSE